VAVVAAVVVAALHDLNHSSLRLVERTVTSCPLLQVLTRVAMVLQITIFAL